MSETSGWPRTQLAASPSSRVEIDEAGVMHVLAGNVTLHLDREACEDLATTLARAVYALSKRQRDEAPRSGLRLVRSDRTESSSG